MLQDEQTQERALIERARTDADAFGVLFERYFDKIYGYALRRTGDVAFAEDVAADTFLKAFDRLWQFRWTGAPFSAWLYRIAGNEILMRHRKNARGAHSLEMMLESEQLSEPADPSDLREELMEAEEALQRERDITEAAALLRALPAHYAEALALRHLEGKSIEEIAVVLGKPEGTVKSLLSRGLAKLKDAMETQRMVGSGISKQAASGAVTRP